MIQYKVEDNINFYDELFKSLDDSDDESENVCQITGSDLIENFVTLDCQHKFNYLALYKEIHRQRFVFKTYDFNSLSKLDKFKIRENKVDYFIRCPYCRNVQFSILPFYENMGVEKTYGINSVDTSLPNRYSISGLPTIDDHNIHSFMLYGVHFDKGPCCYDKLKCPYVYVALIPNTNLTYCKFHYKKGLKQHYTSEQNKLKENKQKLLKEKKNAKEELLNKRKQLFDEKNAERLAKGLPPLKRLPNIKLVSEAIVNEVLPAEPISVYVPDTEKCVAILKSGPNKGKQCSCNKVNGDFCKRHTTV